MPTKPLQIGDFNRVFQWQRKPATPTRDAYGQPLKDWQTLGEFWASKTPAGAREQIVSERLKATISDVIKCIAPGDVKPEDRLQGVNVMTGEAYILNIAGVQLVDDNGLFMIIYCTEVLNPAEQS